MTEKVSLYERVQQIREALGISDATPAHIQLKRLRERLGWTQAKLAEKLGVDTGTISRWENRARKLPNHVQRRNLQKFLCIPAHKWREEDEQMNTDHNQLSIQLSQESSSQEHQRPLVWHVPSDRNPYFTDQKNLVQHLHERLTAGDIGATHQAISGLGGVGKTQLALAYAYQYQHEYTAVLWVGASTQIQLLKELTHLATLLQVPEAQKTRPHQRTLVNEVFHWLSTKSEWLLILDNVEEDFDEKDAVAMEEAFKLDRILAMLDNKGHILLTTRSQSLARLVQNFLLEEMQPEEGAHLLLLRDGRPSSAQVLKTAGETDREEALALSQLLGGLPLALEQARAYIEATGCGIAGYRQLYEEYRKDLLQSVTKGSRLEKEYKESVATTWLISFRHIEQQSAVASAILKLYAYLAPDMIPEDILLKGAAKLDGDLHLLAGNKLQFNRACEVLLNYSLIKRNAKEAVLSLHRLIQAVVQDNMEEAAQHFWAEQAVRAVRHAFFYATDQEVERYVPHAEVCAAFIERYHLTGREVAELLKMVAKAVDEHGWYARAQPLYMQAFQAFLSSFGADDPHTLHAIFDALHIYMDMGASALVANTYIRIIEDATRILGPDHPDLLDLLNNATWVLLMAGDYRSAVQMNLQALHILCSTPDIDVIEHAKTYQTTAEISVLLGQVDAAEKYFQKATILFEQVLGSEHAEVANTLAGWAGLCLVQGNLEEAEKRLRQVLVIRQRILGRDHPETADSLVYLAPVLWRKACYSEAEECYQQALTIRQQKLGPSHPGVLQILRNLAELAATQQRNEVAEQYFHQAFALAPSDGEVVSYEYLLLLQAYDNYLQQCGRMDEANKIQKEEKIISRKLFQAM